MNSVRTIVSRVLLFTIVLFTFIAISSCAAMRQKTYHGFLMKGSIIETYDSEVYLCIGSRDGASVGQELDVYKVTSTYRTITYYPFIYYHPGSKTTEPVFKRENTGRVKITEIIDEHFAKARIISGTATKNDIVELTSP